MSSTCPPSPLHTQRLQRTKTQGNQTPLTRLNVHYEAVTKIILSKQNPVTGLIPASVAVTVHGDYRDAWVRQTPPREKGSRIMLTTTFVIPYGDAYSMMTC